MEQRIDSGTQGVWVRDYHIRNWVQRDPQLDWLDLFGSAHQQCCRLENDQDALNFTSQLEPAVFLAQQNRAFYRLMLEHLNRRLAHAGPGAPSFQVQRVLADRQDSTVDPGARDPDQATHWEATLQAMRRGVAVIAKGVLRNAHNRTVCLPHLLVRSDVLPLLVDDFAATLIPPVDRARGAPRLGGHARFHYVVVLVRFETLHFGAHGNEMGGSKAAYYRALTHLQTAALRQAQGYAAGYALILGRGWQRSGSSAGSDSALHTFGVLSLDDHEAPDAQHVDEALAWIREVRQNGAQWHVRPRPTRLELYPNMKNHFSFPWSNAKRLLADELKELTLLWQCGVTQRNQCVRKHGITRYDDPRLCIQVLGKTRGRQVPRTLANIIAANQQCLVALHPAHAAIQPAEVVRSAKGKHRPPSLRDERSVSWVDDLGLDSDGTERKSSVLGAECKSSVLGAECKSSVLGAECKSSVLGAECKSSVLGAERTLSAECTPGTLSGRADEAECKPAAEPLHARPAERPDEFESIDLADLDILPDAEPAHDATVECKLGPGAPVATEESKIGLDRSNDAEVKRPAASTDTSQPTLQRFECATHLPSVFPARLVQTLYDWRKRADLEFFVDFETKSSIADPLDLFPRQHDTTMISKIGCLFWNAEERRLQYCKFTCHLPTPAEEKRVLNEWLTYMDAVRRRYAPNMLQRPRVWHWSSAEPVWFERGPHSAVERHAYPAWRDRVHWCDLLQVVRPGADTPQPAEALIVQGALNFSLKSVAKALKNLGRIDHVWPPSQVDNGLSAMIALIACDRWAQRQPAHLQASAQSAPFMDEIDRYLQIDVLCLRQILEYLRQHH